MSKGKVNNEYYWKKEAELYIKLYKGEVETVANLAKRVEEWKTKYEELHKLVHEGFQGGCYVCEIVGEKNIELDESLKLRDKEIDKLKATLSGAYRKNYTGYRCSHTDERLYTLEKI
jgi:predicted metallopeptidase